MEYRELEIDLEGRCLPGFTSTHIDHYGGKRHCESLIVNMHYIVYK